VTRSYSVGPDDAPGIADGMNHAMQALFVGSFVPPHHDGSRATIE
jgi:hypothetical protein